MNGRARKLLSATGAVAKADHHLILRGGWLRRTERGGGACATWLSMIAAAAMGLGMNLSEGEPALAQKCKRSSGSGNISFDCR